VLSSFRSGRRTRGAGSFGPMVERKTAGEKRNGAERGRSDAVVRELPTRRVAYAFISA
jgi:hypothetical protein